MGEFSVDFVEYFPVFLLNQRSGALSVRSSGDVIGLVGESSLVESVRFDCVIT